MRPYVDALLVSITADHGRLFCVRVDKIAAVTEMAETRTSVYMLGGGHLIFPDAEHVVSVEVLRPPVKVGDVIETAEQGAGLPALTTLIQDDGDVWQKRDGWWRSPGETGGWADPGLPATVLYLPDG